MKFNFVNQIKNENLIISKLIEKPLIGNYELKDNNLKIFFPDNNKVGNIDISGFKDIAIDFKNFDQKNIDWIFDLLYKNFYTHYSKKSNSENLDININLFDYDKKILEEKISLNNSIYLAKFIGDFDSLDDGTPEKICEFVQEKFKVHEKKVKINIYDENYIETNNFNLISAVSKGSKNKPRILEMIYQNNDSIDFIALVGKGITFDSGGVSLKPSDSMRTMRLDKCGASNSIAIMNYVVENDLKINLVVVCPFAENSISSNAIYPSQVVKSHSGLTVAIDNTDAEGRLVLADAMSFVQSKHKVNTLITIATLTGTITVTLGKYMTGLFTNNLELAREFEKNTNEVGDEVWILPIHKDNIEAVKNSTLADITNSPSKKYGSSSQAAAFLKEFVQEKVNFLHLDIGGTGVVDNRSTGAMVKGIINYLKERNKK